MTASQNKYKIVHVTNAHPADDARVFYREALGLASRGYAVTVVGPYHHTSTLEGLKIIALHKFGKLLFRMTFGAWWAIFKAVLQKPGLVHIHDPELLPPAMLLKCFTKAKVVFDVHEDYVNYMKHKPYLPGILGKVCSIGMSCVLRLASRVLDGFVFADDDTADYFSKMPQSRKFIFYNFPVKSLFPEKQKPWGQRIYDVGFVGSMSRTSGTFVMLEAIVLLKKTIPDVKCLFIGEPSSHIKAEVKAYLQEYQLEDNIKFTGRIPHVEVPKLLQDCKVGLIGLLDIPKFHANIATKMFEYMASGVPIVSSDLPPERRFIVPDESGYLVEPGNAMEMSAAIRRILCYPAKGQRLSQFSRKTFLTNGYFAENQAEKLAVFYRTLLEQNS